MFERIRQSYVLDVFFFICSCLLSIAVVLGATWAIYRYPGAPEEAVQVRFRDGIVLDSVHGEIPTISVDSGSFTMGNKSAGLYLIEKTDGTLVLAVAKPHSVLPTCKVEIRGQIAEPDAEERVTMSVKTSHFECDNVTVVNGSTLEVEDPTYRATLGIKSYFSMVIVVSIVMVITGYTVVHDIKKRLG